MVADQEIVDALERHGGRCTAKRLCDALTTENRSRAAVQLSIQRAMDRKVFVVEHDWTLALPAL